LKREGGIDVRKYDERPLIVENRGRSNNVIREKNTEKAHSRSVSANKRHFIARKPSGNWRKGDDMLFIRNDNDNLEQLKKIYASSSPGIKYIKKLFRT
jgi:hypothetical protein